MNFSIINFYSTKLGQVFCDIFHHKLLICKFSDSETYVGRYFVKKSSQGQEKTGIIHQRGNIAVRSIFQDLIII